MRPDDLSSCTRRALLRRFGGLGLGGLGLNLTAITQASAAGAADYRALVCVFLTGGNDAYNTVLATDADSWSAYEAARGTSVDDGIALAAPGTPGSTNPTHSLHARLGGVLPIHPAQAQGRSFALHPSAGELASLFDSGRMAVVPNVGPLTGTTTKQMLAAGSASLPARRFSHNDQQSVWQTFSPEGATKGWGGRMADLLLSANGQPMFSAVSLAGQAAWLGGQTARSYQMAATGPLRMGDSSGRLFGSALAQQTLERLSRSVRADQVLAREHAAVAARAIDAEQILRTALPATGGGPWGSAGLASGQLDPLLLNPDPVTGQLTPNPLAAQLQGVARLIAARQTLGMRRQVFFVSLDGFDTHDVQAERHARLLARLAQGLAYFDRVLRAMGVDQQVTTFTASEFGRNFASNGDGSDHGWGGHHLVMGGAVRGGDVHGRFPRYGRAAGGPGFDSDDQLNGGALLPAVPVDSYAATLGRWMGLGDAQLLDILPNLGRFDTGVRQLGFMV